MSEGEHVLEKSGASQQQNLRDPSLEESCRRKTADEGRNKGFRRHSREGTWTGEEERA